MHLIAWVCALHAITSSAQAAEVVWLSTPSDDQRAFVAERAGASRPALGPLDFRAAATDWSDADDAAYRALEAVLNEVRAYESKLDGELVIMRDLGAPIAAISAMRDDADRDRLYRALAYQGFAVNRFYEDTLGEDATAEPYRTFLGAAVVEKAWRDAIAIHPEHDVTPYDIAEAPQRVAYGGVRALALDALPASVVPVNLPAGSVLYVDGLRAELGASGSVRVMPGRHLISAVSEGHLLARWSVDIEPGDRIEAKVELTDDVWNMFVGGLSAGTTPEREINDCVEALGGTVWMARPSATGVDVFELSATSPVSTVELTLPRGEDDQPINGFSASVGVEAGWFGSQDFYLQDPASTKPTFKTVNALQAAFAGSIDLDSGIVRLGLGADVPFTIGTDHVALYGDKASRTRLRPTPYLAAGVRWAQALVGYQFPYHPAVGAKVAVPMGAGVELRGSTILGLPTVREREDGSEWQSRPTVSAGLGIGFRLDG
jgi:hypothetical protein